MKKNTMCTCGCHFQQGISLEVHGSCCASTAGQSPIKPPKPPMKKEKKYKCDFTYGFVDKKCSKHSLIAPPKSVKKHKHRWSETRVSGMIGNRKTCVLCWEDKLIPPTTTTECEPDKHICSRFGVTPSGKLECVNCCKEYSPSPKVESKECKVWNCPFCTWESTKKTFEEHIAETHPRFTSSPQPTKEKCDCDCGEMTMDGRHYSACYNCKNKPCCSPVRISKLEGWEIEFQNMFHLCLWSDNDTEAYEMNDRVKAFIRKTLDTQRKDIIRYLNSLQEK